MSKQAEYAGEIRRGRKAVKRQFGSGPVATDGLPRSYSEGVTRRSARAIASKRVRPFVPCKAKGCKNGVKPTQDGQVYCSPACRNREAQRRLRERAKIGKRQA